MGFYNFSEIHWTYLKIEALELLTNFDFEASKTGDFWYREKITQKTKFNFYKKTTEVFIPKGETEYFSDDLHHVIIKNIVVKKDSFSFKPHSFVEVTGDIYFQVETKPVIIQKPILNSIHSKTAVQRFFALAQIIGEQALCLLPDYGINVLSTGVVFDFLENRADRQSE